MYSDIILLIENVRTNSKYVASFVNHEKSLFCNYLQCFDLTQYLLELLAVIMSSVVVVDGEIVETEELLSLLSAIVVSTISVPSDWLP